MAVAAGKGLAFAGFVVAACTSAPSDPVTPGPAVAPPLVVTVSACAPLEPYRCP